MFKRIDCKPLRRVCHYIVREQTHDIISLIYRTTDREKVWNRAFNILNIEKSSCERALFFQDRLCSKQDAGFSVYIVRCVMQEKIFITKIP